jgi:DNA-binding GntR family transcriptional regulator
MTKTTETVGANTYQRIKRDIIFGALKPGSKLKLEALKSSYSASHSTLRETLNRLASEGFVEAPEQRGFLVTPVSQKDLEEIAELRIILECTALERSIKNGDTEWEGNLVAAHHKLHLIEKQIQQGDDSQKEIWKRYDWEFHLALIQACGSKNLLALHEILYDKYLRYQMLVLANRGEEAMAEHKEMLNAARARDASGATEALKRHIKKGLEHTLEAF